MWILLWCWCGWVMKEEPRVWLIQGRAQGTTYTIKYLSQDSVVSAASIDSIFRSVDASLSLYQENSRISRFNREGRVEMDVHMKQVVLAALDVFKQSGGAFDITTLPLSQLWRSYRLQQGPAPTARELRRARQVTGSGLIKVEGDLLLAKKRGVNIDCNGIAQGYTVDVLFHFLESRGIHDLMVEVGGEVRAGGSAAGGRDWRIGVESVSGGGAGIYSITKVIRLQQRSVTTSGNYRQPGHIIDPKKGSPVKNDMISVTVVAEDAMTADAWDNAFFVMGWKKSLLKLREQSGLQVLMVFRDEQGMLRDTSTAGFKKMVVE